MAPLSKSYFWIEFLILKMKIFSMNTLSLWTFSHFCCGRHCVWSTSLPGRGVSVHLYVIRYHWLFHVSVCVTQVLYSQIEKNWLHLLHYNQYILNHINETNVSLLMDNSSLKVLRSCVTRTLYEHITCVKKDIRIDTCI